MLPSAVAYSHPDKIGLARSCAAAFEVPLLDLCQMVRIRQKMRIQFLRSELGESDHLLLNYSENALEALLLAGSQILSVRADFVEPSVEYRRKHGGGRGEMIAKAVGLKGDYFPRVFDATAGLGGDAFVLASVGCEVRMAERVAVVRALLEDALSRALVWSSRDASVASILSRMELVESDSIQYLNTISADDELDVIYMDPMFPERRKTAAVKKEMQVFHRIVGADDDAESLLELSLAKATRRVVVKRPRIAPALSICEPSFVLEGKRNRFDVYMVGD